MEGDTGRTARPSVVVLPILVAVVVLHTIDRQIVAILAEPIRQDLNLSDGQLGLLTGFSFALFYSLAGIPLGWLADRTHRPRLLALSTAAWSAMTLACATATGFIGLALARAGVAIGEAGANPSIQSLLADYFPPDRRGWAQGVLVTALPISSLFALAIGGVVAEEFGWRAAFVVAAIPGFLLAPFVWKGLREPRTNPGKSLDRSALAGQLREAFSIAPLRWLVLALTAASVQSFALALWVPAYFMRTYDWSAAQAGVWLGLAVGLGGVVGSLVSGRLADALRRRSFGAQLFISLGVAVVSLPLFLAMLFSATSTLAVSLFVALQVVSIAATPASYAVFQDLAPERSRGLTFATLALLANLVGMGFAPALVGAISDALVPLAGDQSLRLALSSCAIAQLAAIICMARALVLARKWSPITETPKAA